MLFVVVVVVASQGGHFGLIVLRQTASLFCHQRGSQSSYGALVRCIESLASSTIRFSWSRGQFVLFLCFFQRCSFCDLKTKNANKKCRGTMPACGRCRPADDAGLRTMPPCGRCRPADDAALRTNRAEGHGQLVLSPTMLPEQLRSSSG